MNDFRAYQKEKGVAPAIESLFRCPWVFEEGAEEVTCYPLPFQVHFLSSPLEVVMASHRTASVWLARNFHEISGLGL